MLIRSFIVLTIGVLSACNPPPGNMLGSQSALQVVLDTAVFEASLVFQVHVLKAVLKNDEILRCSDIPGKYRVDNQQITPVVVPAPTATKKQDTTTSVVFNEIHVPADEDLVFVVHGLSQYHGTFVVGRGCIDGQKFEEGSKGTVAVDLKATTGKRCERASDCEKNVTCLKGPGFEEGYCAVTGCEQGTKCPPGSTCILDKTFSGLCLRRCNNINDCEIQLQPQNVHDCIGRLSTLNCMAVCAQPKWNIENCCNAGPASCPDAGNK